MKLGKAFSDNVLEEKRTYMRTSRDDEDSWWLGVGRVLLLLTALCVTFFALLWRLFDLTVVQGHYFRLLADNNRTKELVRHAPRGILYDRTGKPLVQNVPYYRLNRPCTGIETHICVTTMDKDEGDALLKKGLQSGTFLEEDYRREYLYPTEASHLIGYTGELSEAELNDKYYTLHDYMRGDRIGRSGAEAVYEDKLRGRDGKELVEVDSNGNIVRTLGRDKELSGEDIRLSIDITLQKAVADAFPKGDTGAVIVSKPTTGEILALYSSPTYDLNAFSYGLSQKEYEALQNDANRPLFDRAIGGEYPPGSTYKLVTAIAALETGTIDKNTTVEDVGVLRMGSFSFPNWYFNQYGRTEGMVDIVKAIQRSNDIYFYKIGEQLGVSKLAEWSRKLGIGKKLGVELYGEATGLMPDPAWKNLQFHTPEDLLARNNEWYLGDTYHLSIGQGYLLVTPLQVNYWTNIVANNGELCPPTIKKQSSGFLVYTQNGCTDMNIKKQTIESITEGMRRACDTGGTGWPLFNFGIYKSENGAPQSAVSTSSANFVSIPVACKTGTAEYGDPKNNTHAWFTAFAPLPAEVLAKEGITDKQKIISGDPELTVTVLLEGAGEGSSIAGPVVKKIFESWFTR